MGYVDWQVGDGRYLNSGPQGDALGRGPAARVGYDGGPDARPRVAFHEPTTTTSPYYGGGGTTPTPLSTHTHASAPMPYAPAGSTPGQRGYLVRVPDGPKRWECLIDGEQSRGGDDDPGYHARGRGEGVGEASGGQGRRYPLMRKTPTLPEGSVLDGGEPRAYVGGGFLDDVSGAGRESHPRMRKSPAAPAGGHRSYWLVERVDAEDTYDDGGVGRQAVVRVPARSPGVIMMDGKAAPGGMPAPLEEVNGGYPVGAGGQRDGDSLTIHHVHHLLPAAPGMPAESYTLADPDAAAVAGPPANVTKMILAGARPAAPAPHMGGRTSPQPPPGAPDYDRCSSGDEAGPMPPPPPTHPSSHNYCHAYAGAYTTPPAGGGGATPRADRRIKTPFSPDNYTQPNVVVPPAVGPVSLGGTLPVGGGGTSVYQQPLGAGYGHGRGQGAGSSMPMPPRPAREVETQTDGVGGGGPSPSPMLLQSSGAEYAALRDAYGDDTGSRTRPTPAGSPDVFNGGARSPDLMSFQRYPKDQARSVVLQLFAAHGVTYDQNPELIDPWLDNYELLDAIGKLTSHWVPVTRYGLHANPPAERWFTVLSYRDESSPERAQPWLAWFQEHAGGKELKDRCPLADIVSFRCGKNCLGVAEFQPYLGEPGWIKVGGMTDASVGGGGGSPRPARKGRTEGCMVIGFARRTLLLHCEQTIDRRDLATLFKACYYINQEARMRSPSPARRRGQGQGP